MVSGRPAPRPVPPPSTKRWFQTRRSPYPWEQEALDYVESLMPKVAPYYAWATFSFTASSGRVNECDLFIATPGGLHLVELKAHPGRVVNHGEDWRFHGQDRTRNLKNPLHLIDLKSKELKGRLERAARSLGPGAPRIPRIEPSVFLTDPNLISELDEVQRARIYARDAASGLPEIWDGLLGKPPLRDSQRVSERVTGLLPDLMNRIGISASQAHLRFGDEWKLDSDALDAGPTWEDKLARRNDLVREEGRVRIYLVDPTAPDETKQSIERAARREYEVLQGINHRGIAEAVQIREHQGGQAILFRHRHTDLRLDSYLNVHGAAVAPETRRDLVRQLAEAVRYAHNRSLYHRALSARSVYVSAKEDGSDPVLRIIDWQTAARDFDTTSGRTIGNSPFNDEHVEDSALAYLAPESDGPYPDPVELDMFGLGAVAYLILTGRPPADSQSGLLDRIQADQGLHPYAVAEGLSVEIDKLIFDATRNEVGSRLSSADEFLARFDSAEEAAADPGESWAGTDPLTAEPGNPVDGDEDGAWTIDRVLGTGATGRALLVTRTVEDDDGNNTPESRVFKVAVNEDAAASQLHTEARILGQVGGGAIVKLLRGPRTLGGRTVLDLEYAGERSLRTKLTADGRLTYHELAEFGADLFKALDQLAAKGVRHRDIKPDNFGVLHRADRVWELKLFDFSHAHVSDRDVKTGTRGYLDPFIGSGRRPDFDDHAERYAATVTLHEMASQERPDWGVDDPRVTTAETPRLSAELFEPALREGLTGFFNRALHRDVSLRFDTFRQMDEAWRKIFREADDSGVERTDTETLDEQRDRIALEASLETLLVESGLSPRAVSVAAGFNATTVEQLLHVPSHLITKARGSGFVVRKELLRRHKQWTAALLSAGEPAKSPQSGAGRILAEAGFDARFTVDDLATLLTPAKNNVGASVVRLTLGLPDQHSDEVPGRVWPLSAEIASSLGISQATVNRAHVAAVKNWAAASWLTGVRDELVTLVEAAGRVMTVTELASGLRARRGTTSQTPQEALAKSLPVVRAAVEAESWTGANQADDHEPRLAAARLPDQVLICLESLPGTNDPTPDELAEYAAKLGGRADDLAARDPLPGRAEVIRELRAIAPPEGMTPLAETRLVSLAAALSSTAVASPRLDLYPRDLDLVRALRISQAPAGVRRDRGITAGELLTRLRAWFPELEGLSPAPTHVALGETLKEAGFRFTFEVTTHSFFPPAPTRQWSTGTGLSTNTMGALERTPSDQVTARLHHGLEEGGFLALTLDQKYLPGTASLIMRTFPVVEVDVAEVFLGALRGLADEHGVAWEQLLRAEEKLTRTDRMPAGLGSYVTQAWSQTLISIMSKASAARTILFLHNAGLIGRYWDDGGHSMLVTLQNAARRPADRPFGMWLLCPSEAPKASPNLDGRTVEVTTTSERALLDKKFLESIGRGP